MIPGPGYSGNTENKVRVRIYIASVDVNHIGLLHECFAVLQRQLDAIVPWFDLERKATRVVRARMLALTSVDVDYFNASPVNGTRPFRPANDAADRAVGFDWLRTEIDDGTAVACQDAAEDDGDCRKPNRSHMPCRVETRCPQITLCRRNCKHGASWGVRT